MRDPSTIALCLLFATSFAAPAQDEVASRDVKLNANGNIFDVRWAFDAKKGLLLDPNPNDGGETKGLTPYFPGDPIEGPFMSFLRNSGSAGFLTMLLFGNEDLASHCYADYHFRRVGLDRSDQAVRMRIAVPNQGETPFDRRLNTLHRILAVRIAERRGIKGAIPELRMLSAAKNEDTLLRWAAQDALATLTGVPVSKEQLALRFPSLTETLATVPDRYDVIFSMDHSRIPFVREIAWLGRRMGMEVTMSSIKDAGGTCSPALLAGAQVMSDSVSLAFFELARNLGNFRIARITATTVAGRGKKEPDGWARIDGYFDPAPLLRLLGEKGHEVKGDIAKMPTHEVRVTQRFITFRTTGYPMEKTGGKAEKLMALGLDGTNQLFVQFGKLQRLMVMTGAPLTQIEGARFLARVDANRKVTAEAHCKNTAQARGLFNLIGVSTKQALDLVHSGVVRGPQFPDAKLFEKLFVPKFDLEDDSERITMEWDAGQLSFANILEATFGIKNAVSTQDGPVKPK